MPPSPSASSASSGCFDLPSREDADELAGFHDDSAGSLVVFVDGEGKADSARLPADSLDPASRSAVVEWILKVLSSLSGAARSLESSIVRFANERY